MKTIAMYDITGIQEFIFASGKVKENVGASLIVQNAFETYLNEAIKETVKEESKYRTEWKEYPDFQICSDPELQAEVIYTGGGNAMAVYHNKETAVNVTKRLSYDILSKTGGTLKFAVAYLDTECKDFLKDKDELIKRLKINKYQMVHTTPLLGIGITREGGTDGLPATENGDEKNEYLSKSACFKRNENKNRSGYFDSLLTNTKDYAFPPEFDDLGQKIGENHIAVVHIDGNNMGEMLNDLLPSGNSADYAQSINTMREFSKEIDKRYRLIMNRIVRKLTDGLKDNDFYKKLNPVVKDKKLFLPIRPIVLNGDDVTFVCNGKIGIALAEEFLTDLHNNSEIHINGKKITLSACAGVAIVKSHFPFYRAYELAEELCRSAKMKGKILAKINKTEEIGNWLDFHIVQSGITTSLNEIRNKFYQVPGMEVPKELKYPEYADTPEMRCPQYNLLWRPWCVSEKYDQQYQWNELKDIYTEFTREEKETDGEVLWKRSRLKKLESEMTRSESDAQACMRECKSRGFRLPGFCKSSDLFRQGQTPYFDALELLDFYVQLPEKERISNEN